MISDLYRCIFVHIPKTGGSSIEEVIWPGERKEEELWMGLVSEYHNKYQTGGLQHLFASQILPEIGAERFHSYFKFSIVRNPYDRIVSQFVFMRLRPDLRAYIGMTEDDGFSHYLSLIAERKHVQWEEQTAFLYGSRGELLVDFLGRYETFERDVRHILRRVGLDPAIIPHSLHGKRGPYPDYYGPGDQARVARLFERDLECLKYSF